MNSNGLKAARSDSKRKNKRSRLSVSLSALTIASIALSAAVAVTICIIIFSSVYSNAMTKSLMTNSEQTVRQTSVAIDNYLDTMKSKLSTVTSAAVNSRTADDFNAKITALAEVQSDIYAIMVYDRNGSLISCASDGELKKQPLADLSFDKDGYETAFDARASCFISKPHVQTLFRGEYPWVVTIATETDTRLFGKEAYIAIDFSFSEIAKYIDNVGVGSHGYCFVIDSSDRMVYHPQQQLLFAGIKSESEAAFVGKADGVYSDNSTVRAVATTSDGHWRIVGVSFTDEIAVQRRTQILVSIAISLACCAVIVVAVLFIYSRIVTAPVRSLIRAMKAFERDADGFEYTGGTEKVRELRALSDSFEHMEKRIRRLMDKVRSEETALRKTELKALQAQINPHFLYNTLDSIQWMCEQGRTEDATKMVGALAKLFRISISRGHELITISDEVKHAQNYLIIQSYRYRNQFAYSFDVEQGLENCLCNKITIQPLIENAIYHGIDRMVDEGEIKISISTAPDDENDIIIKVEDNGIGMTEEQCRKILQKEKSDSSGIGVKNVNDRLRIYFGEKYGISIESELDVGTTVIIRIPKITKEDANEIQ